MIWNVAVPQPQHSPMFWQRASSQTVTSRSPWMISSSSSKRECTDGSRTRIQAGRSWAMGLQGMRGSAFRGLDQPEEVAVGVDEAGEPPGLGVLDLAEELDAPADEPADEGVEVVRLDPHQDARLLEEVAAAGPRRGAALDAQLEIVAAGPEAVVVVGDVHLHLLLVERQRRVQIRREDGDPAANAHTSSPTGTASSSKPKTSCRRSTTASRASARATGRPSSCAREVNCVPGSPQAENWPNA